MGEWTNFKINEGYELTISGRNVTIHTIHGSFTQSVDELRRKLQNPHLLVDVAKMFQVMLDYAEKQEVK